MTTYRITSPTFSATLTVDDDGLITAAEDALDFSVGIDWQKFMLGAKRFGWAVQPVIGTSGHIAEVVLDNVTYDLHWIGNRLVRITRHEEGMEPEDILPRELPDEVRELIE